MEIRCRCTACQAKFKVDARYAGKKARCPKCQQIVAVPTESSESASAASSSNLTPPAPATPPAAAVPQSSPPVDDDPLAFLSGGAPRLIAKKPAAPSAAPAASSNRAVPSAKNNAPRDPRKLVIGVGVTAVVLLLWATGLVFYYTRPRSAKPQAEKIDPSITTGTVYLDWPPADRDQAMLVLDGLRENVGSAPEFRLILKPGKHKVEIRRRGFQPFERDLTVGRGTTEHVRPEWKPAATIVADTTPVAPAEQTGDRLAASGGVNNGPTVTRQEIPGFAGWLQSIPDAAREATAKNKDVLVVFAISDGSAATREFVEALAQPQLKRAIEAHFIPVVLDYPRTQAGNERVENNSQNRYLRELYDVTKVPAVAMLDRQERPYFIQREFESGLGGLPALLEKSGEFKAERDRLLGASMAGDEQQQLTAAGSFLEWIVARKLFRPYEAQLAAWHTAAQRLDPQNAGGKLEQFFESHWLARAASAGASQELSQVLAVVKDLDPWLTKRFAVPDRGVRLHMTAAAVLLLTKRQDEAFTHVERAVTYEPVDKELRDDVARLRRSLKNRDVQSFGTGYLVSSAGYVLTNHHVIDGQGAIAIRFPEGKADVPAQLVAADAERDIALLQVAVPGAEKCQPLAIVPDPIRRGAAVAAFGYPLMDELGAGLKFTDGAVSALPDDSNDQRYLLDITVNPGNSGGPLCDRRGNVVGMIVAKTANFGLESSYGYAIPAPDLVAFLAKHLPAAAPRVSPASGDATLGWDQVDEKVSSGVLLIVKKR